MDLDWRTVVRTLAPTLASAFGTPVMGMAVKVIADKVLGEPDASEADVAAVLSSGQLTGEQVVALKQADAAFALRMRELDIDLEKLGQAAEAARLADVADARANMRGLAEVKSGMAWGAPLVSALILMGYFGCIWLLFVQGDDIPPNSFQLVNVLFGALTVAFTQVTGFWLGSSIGSKRSGDAVRQIAAQKGQP